MAKTKKTGIYGLHGSVDKARTAKKPNGEKKAGLHTKGRTTIGAPLKVKKKTPSSNRKGTMAELLQELHEKRKGKEAKAASADAAPYANDGDEEDEEDDPDMDEDMVSDDLQESEHEEEFTKKDIKAKPHEDIEQELRTNAESMSLRQRGRRTLEKMADRIYADNAHLKDAPEKDIKNIVDFSADEQGYFELSYDVEGELDVPLYPDHSLPEAGDSFCDSNGTYTKVERKPILDKQGRPVKAMQGGWEESSFPVHTLPDIYAKRFLKPKSKSRGGRTIKEADAAAAEESRRASAMIVKYETHKKPSNAGRVEVADDLIAEKVGDNQEQETNQSA
ncbi:hypothetical protein PTNB73_00425 [Pyrenophora teres f. teres]|nr:hypothetical protein HRS9139_01667 [Pyrenophora teres f. teres]KAE8851408.1 hypothetical protein HRS9122_01695 [Pyrenophora teres f. teres]KAE8873793.1 hypothetical protein PTNB73_00425 [Pyrenophora teres f. teres]